MEERKSWEGRQIWSKKNTVFLSIAIAILISAIVLCCIKGLFFTFFIGIPLGSCLSGLFIYLAFRWQFDEAFYKLDKEKEKAEEERKKDDDDTWDYLPMPYHPPAWE